MLQDNQQFNEKVKSNSAFMDELRQRMPEFFSAAKFDEDGNEVQPSTFDNEKFQEALKDNNINELSSGYRLDFIGKNYAKKQAGERPTTVIVPDNEHNQKEENRNSKNLFFTGDYNDHNTFFKVDPLPKWVTRLPITIVIESTYGNMKSSDVEKIFKKNSYFTYILNFQLFY